MLRIQDDQKPIIAILSRNPDALAMTWDGLSGVYTHDGLAIAVDRNETSTPLRTLGQRG